MFLIITQYVISLFTFMPLYFLGGAGEGGGGNAALVFH